MITLAMLAVFSSLAMNVILQFGIGLKGTVLNKTISKKKLLAGSAVFFLSVLFLWLIFTFARTILFLGFFEYILLFPVSVLTFSVLEYLKNRFILKNTAKHNDGVLLGGVSSSAASVCAALFIMLNVAGGILEALVLSLGFTLGIVLAIVIVAEIRRRSEMEAVPRWLRGGPLVLISMGLLSLVFSSGAIMLFEVLGAL